MAYKALYRTYRPDDFEQMAGQKHIVKTLENTIQRNQIAHAYLFCGPRGTGKTTTAKIFAKAINCTGDSKPCGVCDNCLSALEGAHPDIIEIDAASNNGVEEARNLIEKVKYAPILGKYKIYIIDEVHMMSTGAFNALLKTIEEPPAHVIFILATTEPHKVIPTILSRCQRFDFNKISRNEIVDRMKYVIEQEHIEVEDRVLESIAILADGGLRDALSILDQCRAYSPEKITLQDVNQIYGIVSTQEICDLIEEVKKKNTKNLIQTIERFDANGTDIKRLTTDIVDLLKESVIYDYAKEQSLLDILTLEQVRILKQGLSTKQRLAMIEILMDTYEKYRYSSNVVSYFEIGMLKIMNDISDSQMVEEVSYQKEVKADTLKVEDLKVEELKVEASEEEPTIKEVVEESLQNAVVNEDAIVEQENVESKEEPTTSYELPEEDFVETIEEIVQEIPTVVEETEKKEDKKENDFLSMDFVLSLLVGANKPEKMRDIELLREVNKYMFDMTHGKYASLLKNKTIIASAAEYIVLSVDSEAVANEINELDKNEEFLLFTQEVLQKRKKVFAITSVYAGEAVEAFKVRSANQTLPTAAEIRIKEEEVKEQKDEKLEKISSYLGEVDIRED